MLTPPPPVSASCQACGLPPALPSQRTMRAQGLDQHFRSTEKRKTAHLGAWLRCTECTAAQHFKCLAKPRQQAVMDDINVEAAETALGASPPPPITHLSSDIVREDIPCAVCYAEPALCYLCGLDPVGHTCREAEAMWGQECEDDVLNGGAGAGYARPVFRCKQCLRPAHYECLAMVYEGQDGGSEYAASFRVQSLDHWQCPDCVRWGEVERVLAWRRMSGPCAAKVSDMNSGLYARQLDLLAREYLVKFCGQSWRQVAWVPYAWIMCVASSKLEQFRLEGSFTPDRPCDMTPVPSWTRVQYKARYKADTWEVLSHDPTRPWEHYPAPFTNRRQREQSWASAGAERCTAGAEEQTNAQDLIPVSWSEPERVLDVFFRASVLSLTGSEHLAPQFVQWTEKQLRMLRERPLGSPPGSVAGLIHISNLDGTELLDPSRSRVDVTLTHAAWMLVKWTGLGYAEASWLQLRPGESLSTSFSMHLLNAYQRYIFVLNATMSRPSTRPHPISLPNVSQVRTLSKRQVQDLGSMIGYWNSRQSFVLSAEPGGGKTGYIIAMIAWLAANGKSGPYLLLVPPHTITYWTRLLRLWLPTLNTVAYAGNNKACSIVETYELHPRRSVELKDHLNTSTFKAEIVIADVTDQTVVSALGQIECHRPWDLVVVDVLAVCRASFPPDLTRIQSNCRVLLSDSAALPRSPQALRNLTAALQSDVAPSSASDAGDLSSPNVASVSSLLSSRIIMCAPPSGPPSVTRLVVPTALSPMQAMLYSSVLNAHAASIKRLSIQPLMDTTEACTALARHYSLILVDLLRVCQNAFFCGNKKLNSTHKANPSLNELLKGSGKLVLLQALLRHLCLSGHRTVVVSQFTMDLDVIEELVLGQGEEYIRVDRDSSPSDIDLVRQAWNEEGATVPILLLHSRTGATLNLLGADTVVVRSHFSDRMRAWTRCIF